MTDRPETGRSLLLAGVLLTGLNLRGAIAAVSPVLPEIRAGLGLSPAEAGLLTTLPVLCFAVLAPPAAWVGRRMGPERAVTAGLVVLAAATALRVLDGIPVLLTGTFVIGAAMTLGNVLLPPVVKRDFGERAGTVTGLYTAALAGGAAATAALTAPLAGLWGWRGALACWAVLALVAAAVWGWATRRSSRLVPDGPAPGTSTGRGVWGLPRAWAVCGVLALQSALYYAFTAWLPTLLVDEVGSLDAGTAAATTFQLVGIAGTLVVPAVIGRLTGQRGLGVVIAAAWVVLPVGLLTAPGAWPLWAVIGGLAQGAGVALAYTVLVLRSADDDQARRLSGMAQLVGFSVGAVSPLVVGALYAVSGAWVLPLSFLIAVAVALGAVLLVAGRAGTLEERRPPRRSELPATG
jgi:MFS transporter, CP family, cyanate transporter